MAKRPDLPSRHSEAPAEDTRGSARRVSKRPTSARGSSARTPRGARAATGGERTVDVRDWLGGVRLSAFMFIMLGLVMLAVLVLLPTVGTYIEQRQRIAALEESVQVTEDRVAELEAERDRWNDRAYITTQARERLYYHLPGEIVFLVDNDIDPATLPAEQAQVSDEVQAARSDWMGAMLRSITEAGLTKNAVPVPAPTPTPTPSETPAE